MFLLLWLFLAFSMPFPCLVSLTSGKDFLKSHVFSWRRKVYSEDGTSSGRAFQVFQMSDLLIVSFLHVVRLILMFFCYVLGLLFVYLILSNTGCAIDA